MEELGDRTDFAGSSLCVDVAEGIALVAGDGCSEVHDLRMTSPLQFPGHSHKQQLLLNRDWVPIGGLEKCSRHRSGLEGWSGHRCWIVGTVSADIGGLL